MDKHKSTKQSKRKETARKYAEPLHAEMSFDEFVARIVRVKPDKQSKEWKAGNR